MNQSVKLWNHRKLLWNILINSREINCNGIFVNQVRNFSRKVIHRCFSWNIPKFSSELILLKSSRIPGNLVAFTLNFPRYRRKSKNRLNTSLPLPYTSFLALKKKTNDGFEWSHASKIIIFLINFLSRLSAMQDKVLISTQSWKIREEVKQTLQHL